MRRRTVRAWMASGIRRSISTCTPAATGLTPELREIVLTVTVAAKQNDATIFLVEVKQAGVFLMRNLTEADAQARHQQRLPERAVSVRPRCGLAPRHTGRLPAVPAAAGQLRRAVRASLAQQPPAGV